ncbi:hypothetical protein [Paracoccus beibuensis]|uniref:hypothetical protein n=1 Tax=Paracoccus beibuensis TaxID=547602 RepID=UPI00223F28F3|nr:hypothetical protein [Paracoccus beibuensis]
MDDQRLKRLCVPFLFLSVRQVNAPLPIVIADTTRRRCPICRCATTAPDDHDDPATIAAILLGLEEIFEHMPPSG